MDQSTAEQMALRYNTPPNMGHTVSTHEPEMLIKVVEGPEHLRNVPRRRDHSGACQIEIDVLQHHNPQCDEAVRNIKDIPSEDIQGSYVVIDRFPVATCKNKLPAVPVDVAKPVIKSMHDEHAPLRASRKGTRLHDPEAFDAKLSEVRSTIENIMLLPKVGCSQPNFVARMEQKANKIRYDPTAQPEASNKPRSTVYAANTKSKSAFERERRPTQHSKDLQVYQANEIESLSPFDECMDPTKNKSNLSKTNAGTVNDQPETKRLYHTCTMNKRNLSASSGLEYKDLDGNLLPPGTNPFGTAVQKQSVYAVVSKTSRTSRYSSPEVQHESSNITHAKKTFKDPCFFDDHVAIVMAAGVRPPIMPTEPDAPPLPKDNPNDLGTMTSNMQCCPPTCDVTVIGKPKENFKEESGSEDELNVDPATDAASHVEPMSKNPYYYDADKKEPNEGCFKRVFLCGACRKNKPENPPPGDGGSDRSKPFTDHHSDNGSQYTGDPYSLTPRRGTTDATANHRHSSYHPPSQTGSNNTGRSVKSHSKQGHNSHAHAPS